MDKHRERMITDFLDIFCNTSLHLIRDKSLDGRKFSRLYPQLEVKKPDGMHSYNAKITYRGTFITDDDKPIDLWVEDTIEVSVMRVNATFGIEEEYMTVKFAKNSPFLTDAKKKFFIRTAEKFLSMRVEEIK